MKVAIGKAIFGKMAVFADNLCGKIHFVLNK